MALEGPDRPSIRRAARGVSTHPQAEMPATVAGAALGVAIAGGTMLNLVDPASVYDAHDAGLGSS